MASVSIPVGRMDSASAAGMSSYRRQTLPANGLAGGSTASLRTSSRRTVRMDEPSAGGSATGISSTFSR